VGRRTNIVRCGGFLKSNLEGNNVPKPERKMKEGKSKKKGLAQDQKGEGGKGGGREKAGG